ncbi:hypothetical protein PYCC9005_002378 [Savitreella phatthalungensis]
MHFLRAICAIVALASAYEPLFDEERESFLANLPSLKSLAIKDGSLLKPLLVPRVSGTQGATDILHFLRSKINTSHWHLEEDRFVAPTPISPGVEFVNLIATLDPIDSRPEDVGRLVLAAHYDSKREPFGFIGATDSSVPCAILLYVAQQLTRDMLPPGKGLQLIFFDGEEAVNYWTDEDSIYGSRHLAAVWEQQYQHPTPTGAHRTRLESMDLLVLLDLLGTDDASVPSFFQTTQPAYDALADLERLVHGGRNRIFSGDNAYHAAGTMGDDHTPFLHRGVEVLHVIPLPFPRVWHTQDDNADALDQGIIDDLAKILSLFTIEWLQVSWPMNHKRDEL